MWRREQDFLLQRLADRLGDGKAATLSLSFVAVWAQYIRARAKQSSSCNLRNLFNTDVIVTMVHRWVGRVHAPSVALAVYDHRGGLFREAK